MGKYKQWLHHQEIGRRLRDQIRIYEEERARIQKMAPAHPTSLPDLDNPMIAALLAYTNAGNRLSNVDIIKAAMPKMDPDLEQRRPAVSAANEVTQPAGGSAGQQSRADSTSARQGNPQAADSVNGWWQQQRGKN